MSNPEPIAGRMHGLIDQARSHAHSWHWRESSLPKGTRLGDGLFHPGEIEGWLPEKQGEVKRQSFHQCLSWYQVLN